MSALIEQDARFAPDVAVRNNGTDILLQKIQTQETGAAQNELRKIGLKSGYASACRTCKQKGHFYA
jgi:hypothetical protein